MHKPRILLDLDDTITDFLDELVNRYNIKYGTNYTKEHCYKWEINEIFEHNILELIDEEDFFENVKPKPDAVKYIEKWITEGKYDIFIVTSCLRPENYIRKVEWLKANIPSFPLGRIIPITEKSAVWGDVLVDDRPKNLQEWRDNSIGDIKLCLMFDAPHNRKCFNYMRVTNFEYLDNIFKSYFGM